MSTDLAVCKAPVEQLVRQIVVERVCNKPMRWNKYAMMAVHVALESILVKRLYLAMTFAKASVPDGMAKGVLIRHWRSACSSANDWYSPDYNGILLPQVIKNSENKFNPLCELTLDGKNVFEENERLHFEYAAKDAEEKGLDEVKITPPTLVLREGKNAREGFCAPAITRLAKLGKCSGISTKAYPEIRSFAVMFLELLLKGIHALLQSTTETRGDVTIGVPREVVFARDVLYVLEVQGQPLTGFGVQSFAPKKAESDDDESEDGDETEDDEPSSKKRKHTPAVAAPAAASGDV